MWQNTTITVIVFAASTFASAKCFYIRDELMEPIDIARVENNNNHDVGHDIHKRNKREVLELAEGRIAQPVGVRSRDQTVIIVPNTYSGTTAYRNVPYSPYDSSRGTSVVVGQAPGYSNLPRSVEILPANPMVI
ncbi:uncharacterized protein [Choristoneura fumiferana]|uniref:uncharacterized protein n=1 Tax=Choristoneura fumiferana TaxID=7141 RepID=UPI003D15C7C2